MRKLAVGFLAFVVFFLLFSNVFSPASNEPPKLCPVCKKPLNYYCLDEPKMYMGEHFVPIISPYQCFSFVPQPELYRGEHSRKTSTHKVHSEPYSDASFVVCPNCGALSFRDNLAVLSVRVTGFTGHRDILPSKLKSLKTAKGIV
ncbi:MAG: hypothetical protein PHE61_02745 [Candidatus Omnitrophica bacterium]|nr:hypothetical protein [Candidatus Omnitrophota bacterium]